MRLRRMKQKQIYNPQTKDKSIFQQKVVSFRTATTDDSPKEIKKKKPNMDTFINFKHENVTKRRKRSLDEMIIQTNLNYETDVENSALNVPMMIRKNRLLSLIPKLNIRNQEEGLSPPKTLSNNLRSPNELCETPNRNLIQTETTTPELGEFVKNTIGTSTPCNRKYLGLRRTRPSSKK
uniref:Uncharacterized protein n=1 Tax=Glossina pallidipes TaxID=7398 RepID=A0A1A9Z6Y5_GLOPL